MTTVKRRQEILAGIGFPIRTDGTWGSADAQATRWFQEAWTQSVLAVDGVWGPKTEAAAQACLRNHGRVSAHFTLREFACNHAGGRWPRANRNLLLGLEKLRARYYAGGGLHIVSGYRCPAHNAAIGGARGSQHLTGRAADIPPRGDRGRLVTVHQVAALRVFGGLEHQPATGLGCTHVDVRAGGSTSNPSIFKWGS